MRSNKLKYKSIFSFVIFLLVLLKDFIVSYLDLIPERSRTNRTISWFIILPLVVVGVVFSLQVIKEIYLAKSSKKDRFLDLTFYLSLPMLIMILYFFVTILFT